MKNLPKVVVQYPSEESQDLKRSPGVEFLDGVVI